MKEVRLIIISSLLVIVVVLFPFLYLGGNAYILVHDVLDCEFIVLHVLKISGQLLGLHGDTPVLNVMNGLPRAFFHSEFSMVRLFYFLFPSFWAYVVNDVIVRLIGFAGMYLFARDYLMKGSKPVLLAAIGVLFAIIPLYSVFGITVMGQPLLIWAFLNIAHGNKHWINRLVVILFPFYSQFALIAPFIIIALILLYIYVRRSKEQFVNPNGFFKALLLLVVLFIVANFITLKYFLLPGDFVSHRTEWTSPRIPLKAGIQESINTFSYGQYHSSSFKALPIYLFSLLSLFFFRVERKKVLLIIGAAILVALIALFFGEVYPYIRTKFGHSLQLLTTFQFSRFTFFIPLLWFIILGLTISVVRTKVHYLLLLIPIVWQAYYVFSNNDELKINYAKAMHPQGHAAVNPGFNAFYAPHLFAEIDSYINKPKDSYRVGSIGLHPAIAQYNGFYTLDSYQNNYLLSYKMQFRNIIAPELKKDEAIRQYYDEWGSRCYIFSADLGSVWYRKMKVDYDFKNAQIKNLDINTAEFKKMGGEYIFSACPILNYDSLKMSFLKKFTDTQSHWDVYLYKI